MCSLYLPMKRHPVCITSTYTAYATIDTTIINHVYKPDFSSLRSYFLDRKLGPVCHQIGGRVRSSFLLCQWFKLCLNLYVENNYQRRKPFESAITAPLDIACTSNSTKMAINVLKLCIIHSIYKTSKK